MTPPLDGRTPARAAGPELLVLEKWEESVGWLLAHTDRWPKSARFTLVTRIQNLALDIVDELVQARYDRSGRERLLKQANLGFERLRLLFRVARGAGHMSAPGFEGALRRVDEAGRMVHGWRRAGVRGAAAAAPAGPLLFSSNAEAPACDA